MVKPILYLSDKCDSTCSVTAALEATGHRVVSTKSSPQALALLFLIRSAAAVVISDKARKHTGFDLARSMRAIRPQVCIILLSQYEINQLPQGVDACISTGQPSENITSAVRYVLNSRRDSHDRRHCDLRPAA
jgi:DNA-binding NtrC family response regulator